MIGKRKQFSNVLLNLEVICSVLKSFSNQHRNTNTNEIIKKLLNEKIFNYYINNIERDVNYLTDKMAYVETILNFLEISEKLVELNSTAGGHCKIIPFSIIKPEHLITNCMKSSEK